MRIEDQLLLEHKNFKEKINLFFKKLEDDAPTLKVFINNPTEVALSALMPETVKYLTPQKISDSNRILFAVLSNQKFYDWANKYQDELHYKLSNDTNARLDVNKVFQDLAEALVLYGNNELMMSILLRGRNDPGLIKAGWEKPQPIGWTSVDLFVGIEIAGGFLIAGGFGYFVAVAIAVAAVLIAVPVAVIPGIPNPRNTNWNAVSARQFRAITEQLVAHANKLKVDKKLMDPNYDLT